MRPWTELPDPSIPAVKCDWFIGRVASSCLFHTWKRGSTKMRLCKVSIFTGARSCLMHMKEQYNRDDTVCMFRLLCFTSSRWDASYSLGREKFLLHTWPHLIQIDSPNQNCLLVKIRSMKSDSWWNKNRSFYVCYKKICVITFYIKYYI